MRGQRPQHATFKPLFTTLTAPSYREQHAPDLLDGPETAEEGHQTDEDAGGDQDVGRGDVEVGSQQLFEVRLVHHGPDSHHEHGEASQLGGGEGLAAGGRQWRSGARG